MDEAGHRVHLRRGVLEEKLEAGAEVAQAGIAGGGAGEAVLLVP